MDNSSFAILVFLLPIVFMIHDFEEIVFFKSSWVNKGRVIIQKRFPKVAAKFFSLHDGLSTAAFSLVVAEEFILISGISLYAFCTNNYYLWIGTFMAFSLHIIVHIAQWMIIRKYIPCIVTSLLALPYCVYGTIQIIQSGVFEVSKFIYWSIGCTVFVYLNIIFMLRLSRKVDQLFLR